MGDMQNIHMQNNTNKKLPGKGTDIHLNLSSFFVLLLLWLPKVSAHGGHVPERHLEDNPRGLITLDWHLPGISRVVTAGYPDSFGLFAFNGRLAPEVVNIAGKDCIRSHFLAMDIDDKLAFDSNTDLKVRLQIVTQQSGSLLLGYDSHGKIDAWQAPLPAISPTVIEEPITWVEFSLPKARLVNRGMAGTDIAITTLETMKLPGDIQETDITTFVLCDVQLSGFPLNQGEAPDHQQKSHVTLNFVAENQPGNTPVRFGVYNQQGSQMIARQGVLKVPFYEDQRHILSLRDALNPEQFWPHKNRYYQYTAGQVELMLSPGVYQVVVSKGPEYQMIQQRLVVTDQAKQQQQITMKRFANWQERGWYSGDVHIHMQRRMADESQLLTLFQAEDLHVANLLAMSNIGKTHYAQPAYGQKARIVQRQNSPGNSYHAMVPGIEAPRTAFRGHAVSLDIDALRLVDDDYYLYHKYFSYYHEQGAVNGYAHIGSEEFNGSWGLALDTPFGLVDFVEIMQNSKLRTGLWYEHLNLGQQLAPAAGSDFPYFDQPGAVRVYVQTGNNNGDDVDAWFEGLRAGRVFITNGPLIDFRLDGSLPGSSLPWKSQYQLELAVALDSQVDQFKAIDVIHCGKVLASFGASHHGPIKVHKSVSIPSSGWLAVRVDGQYSALAHTGAIYLKDADGQSICPGEYQNALEKMLYRLENLSDSLPKEDKELEYWESSRLLPQFNKQSRALKERIGLAKAHYLRLLEQSIKNDQSGSADQASQSCVSDVDQKVGPSC